MKQRIKEPYYAFNPNKAHFLFERTITFESQAALFAKIPRIIHRLYFPRKLFMLFIGLIFVFVVMIFVYAIPLAATNFAKGFLGIIPLIEAGIIIYFIQFYLYIYLEIRLIKKIYKKVQWPVECYCAFFEEGIYIKSPDMDGIFYWDDFMCMGCSSKALGFNFCPAGTPKGKFFKQYYPRLDNFYIFIDGDEEILSLMQAIDQQYKNLIAFR